MVLSHHRGDGVGVRLLFGHVPSLALPAVLDNEGDNPDGDGNVPTRSEGTPRRAASGWNGRCEWPGAACGDGDCGSGPSGGRRRTTTAIRGGDRTSVVVLC